MRSAGSTAAAGHHAAQDDQKAVRQQAGKAYGEARRAAAGSTDRTLARVATAISIRPIAGKTAARQPCRGNVITNIVTPIADA